MLSTILAVLKESASDPKTRTIRIDSETYRLGDKSLAVLRTTAELLTFLELAHDMGIKPLTMEFIRKSFGFPSHLPVQSRLNRLVEQGAIELES